MRAINRERAMRVAVRALVASVVACAEPTNVGLERLEIRLSPNLATLMVNDTARARLLGFDGSGDTYPAGPVTWSSSDATVAQVDSSGLVTARGTGSADITATVGRLTESLTLSVEGTRHNRAIVASESWTLAGSPHLVEGHVAVGGPAGATVTIEAGAIVLFANGAGLTFGIGGVGSLVASASASSPILFRAAQTPPTPGSWIGLTFRGRTQSELRHVELSGCGGPRNDEQPRACLVLGFRFFGADPTVLLDSVTIEESGAAGVILQGESRFASGSEVLSIRNAAGPVAIVPAGAVLAFPLGGQFVDNGMNEIQVTYDTIGSSGAWGSAGVPWRIHARVLVGGPLRPVVTIPPGTTLVFEHFTGLVVGEGGPGGIRIGAPGGAPVTLSSSAEFGWEGLALLPAALPSSIAETVFENCGPCLSMSGNSFGIAPAPVLENVTVRRALAHGITLRAGARFGAGSNNVVITETRGSPGIPVLFYQASPASLPPGNYTGNTADAIWVTRPTITASETWRVRGVPYWLDGMEIEHAAGPVVTLEPGVVLQISGGIRVGGFAPGGLHAVGTAEAPVVLSGQLGPQAGTWGGIDIGAQATASTLFEHVVIESGGTEWSTFRATIGFARDLGAIVRNTMIRLSGSCAIARLGSEPWATDFTAPELGNIFQDNVGPDQCGP